MGNLTTIRGEVAKRVLVELTLSGKSRIELAGKLHISTRTLRKKLAGEVEFTATELVLACKALNIDIARLCDVDDTQSSEAAA